MGAATSKPSASAKDVERKVTILIAYRKDNDHMRHHARKLCERMPNAAELEVDVSYFACGNPRIVIRDPDASTQTSYTIVLLTDWSNERKNPGLAECVLAKSLAKKPWCAKLVVIPPFFAESTCDREVPLGPNHNEVPYGIVFADIFSTVLENVTFVMTDLHAMQMENYLTRNHCVQIKAEGMRSLLARCVANAANARVVFADEGALKRFEATVRQVLPDCRVSYCVKRKVSADQRTCTIHHVDAEDDDANMADEIVFVIDDIIRSGKSLTDCANECVACGAKDIRVLATHGAFPDDSFVQFMQANQGAIASCSLMDTHENAVRAAAFAPHFYKVYDMAPVYASIAAAYA